MYIMEFSKLIETRRSVRAYASAASKEDIESILEMAQQAPSWKNGQPARCYAVTSPEALTEVREKGLPDFNANSSAGASLIVTTFEKGLSGFTPDGPANKAGNYWGAYDLGLQNAYFVLSASDHGLDTLIMGIRDAQGLRALLDIPEEEEVAAVLSIGYRDGEPALRPRKDLGEIAFFS